MRTYTRTDATDSIIASIEAGDATADQFDVDAIADAIYDKNGGIWDFSDFDADRFWEIVEANAL